MIKKSKRIIVTIAMLIIASIATVVGGTMASLAVDRDITAPMELANDSTALAKWQVSNKKSSVEYCTNKHSETKGLNVRLVQGDSLDFTQIIDLSAVTKNDLLADIYVTPDTIGALDFEKLYFTFTDVKNPNCYLKIAVRNSMDVSTSVNYPWTYFYAGGNNQKLRSTTMWNGRVYNEDSGGLAVVHSFKGNYSNNKDATVTEWLRRDYNVTDSSQQGVETNLYGLSSLTADSRAMLDSVSVALYYDAYEKAVYANGEDRCFWDMDDTTLNDVLWNGFESGKVRLSISADLYKSETANFVIKEIYGLNLSESEFYDNEAPQISVDVPNDGILESYVGFSYKIPSCAVYDEYDDACKQTIKVWYRYDSATPSAVEIVDSKFTASKEGYYAIVYTAKDLSGNEAQEVVWVYAGAERSLTLDLSDDYPTSGFAGEFIKIAEYTIAGEVNEETVVSVKAILDGEETIIKGDGFEPAKSGTYTIQYIAIDYLDRTAEKSYDLEISNATDIQLKDAYTFPQALVSGIEYTIPAYFAHDYTSGSLVKTEMDLYITDKSGERKAENNTFIPNVATNGDTVKLAFRTEGSSLCLEKEIPVALSYVDEKLEMENYFLTDDITKVATAKGISMTAQSENASWLFANKLIAYDFNLILTANIEKSCFSALVITLTDSENSDISLTVKLGYVQGGDTKLIIGDEERVLAYGFRDYGDVNKNDVKVRVNGGKVIVGDVALTDKNFAEFPSGFVYCSIAFEGATVGSEYIMASINGQAVTSSSNDRIRPKINILGDYDVCVDKDEVVTVPKAIAGDVLHGIKELIVTVVDKNGNVVVSNDGISLQNVSANRSYQFTSTEYGQYMVTYTACDTKNGLETTRGFACTVEDKDVPNIQIGEMASDFTVGETIVIPNLQYTDNVTAKENLILFITVFTPDGTILELKGNSNSFIPAQTGKYEIRICVYDEMGNMGYFVKTITVSEGK